MPFATASGCVWWYMISYEGLYQNSAYAPLVAGLVELAFLLKVAPPTGSENCKSSKDALLSNFHKKCMSLLLGKKGRSKFPTLVFLAVLLSCGEVACAKRLNSRH